MAISKIKIGSTEHELQTTIENVDGLQNALNEKAASSHTQAASTITAGTFAGQVVANSSAQTPANSLLRNSKLVSTDTAPTVNGEICWKYE